MFQLLVIYGVTFSSVGLLTLGLFPELTQRLHRYLTVHVEWASSQLSDIFVDLSWRKLFIAHLTSPVLVGLIASSIVKSWWVLLIGLISGFLAPQGVIYFVRIDRQRRFRGQLVDALMILSSSLKAGLSMFQALEVLAEEAPAPMSQEIGLVVKGTKMGMSLEEALKRLKKRIPIDELNLVITAILVAMETGGDVTEVFAKLIETIRERFKIRERIKTLTVIPRLQGAMMAFVPFGFAVFARGMNPHYFDMLFQDQVGNLVGLAAVGLWLMSVALIVYFSRPPR